MKKVFFTAITLIGMATSVQVQAAGDATAGKTKAATCAACHNADGNSMVPTFPKLAGQHEKYIAKQLADFKSGARKDPVMAPMAMPLSEQDMADLGAYFASQTVAIGSANADKARLGEELYRGGNKNSGLPACMACHGPNGTGNPAANFPSLSGQHSAYIAKATKDFRSGARMHPMMNPIAEKMTDPQIDAVSEYVSGLH